MVPRIAGSAPGGECLAMHVEHAVRAGALVQVVDVLGDDQQLGTAILCPFAVEPCQRRMGRIGLRSLNARAPLVVEALDEIGIAAEGLRRRDILHPVIFPQPVLGAEGAQARFGADPGAGEDDDVADALH